MSRERVKYYISHAYAVIERVALEADLPIAEQQIVERLLEDSSRLAARLPDLITVTRNGKELH